ADGVRGDAILTAVARADREVHHLLGQRVERARRHHFFHALPRAAQRRRVVRERPPEVVHVVGLPGRPDIVVNRPDLRARLRVLDQLHARHGRILSSPSNPLATRGTVPYGDDPVATALPARPARGRTLLRARGAPARVRAGSHDGGATADPAGGGTSEPDRAEHG